MKNNDLTIEACDIIRHSFDRFENEIKALCGITTGEWLDSRQICNLLHISIRTLNYYRARMIVPYTRFGSKCYYRVLDVKQVLDEKGSV